MSGITSEMLSEAYDKFKDQWTDPAFGMGAGKKSSYIEDLEPAFLTVAVDFIVFSVYN